MSITKYAFTSLLIVYAFNVNSQSISSIDEVLIKRDTSLIDVSNQVIRNGDVIVFDIPGVGDFIKANKIALADINLILGDVPLSEIPAFIENNEDGTIRFAFSEKYLSSASRQKLYESPGSDAKDLRISIKIGNAVLTYGEHVKVIFSNIKSRTLFGWTLIVAFAIYFGLLLTVFKAAITDNISDLNPNTSDKPSFSFSKSQLAFWTFIIISSFIYIWTGTGDFNSINSTGLILLGITSATISTTNLISAQEETAAITNQQQAKLLANRKRENFFKDILSDRDGLSIHRIQALIFNLVFGIIFIKTVITDYAMPSFNETQLILLGLSNGTYAFLRNSENKNL